jgi:hypothetical protein
MTTNESAATATGLRGRAAAIGRRYAPRENRPLAGYVASMAAFAAAAAGFAGQEPVDPASSGV